MSSRPQFSIKAILATTAVAALTAWAIAAEVTLYSGFLRCVLVLAFPATALAIALQGKGLPRMFCAGALIPLCTPVWAFPSVLNSFFALSKERAGSLFLQAVELSQPGIIAAWSSAVVMGLIVAGISWALAPRSGTDSESSN